MEIKNFLINEKNYKNLVIYFIRYDRGKWIRMLSLHYRELAGNTEEYKLMIDDNIFDKTLDKI